MSKDKRTFDEFQKRLDQLNLRILSLMMKLNVLLHFEPLRALLVRKRFNRIISELEKMKITEYKKGYYL